MYSPMKINWRVHFLVFSPSAVVSQFLFIPLPVIPILVIKLIFVIILFSVLLLLYRATIKPVLKNK